MDWKKALIFAVGIALVLFVISFFGFFKVVSVLLNTNPLILAGAVMIELVALCMAAVRLKILTYGKGYISFPKALRTALSGSAVSLMTPLAMIGGEPLKMYMLRSNIGNTKASAIIAIDGLMEIIAAILVVFFVTILCIGSIPSQLFGMLIVFLIVTGTILGTMMKILFTPHWIGRIVNWIVKRIEKTQPDKNLDYSKMFHDAFLSIMRDRKKLLAVLGVSVTSKLLDMTRIWLVFAAIGIVFPFQTTAIIWAIIIVLLFVPIMPGALAVVEFGAASAIVLFGVPGHLAASGIILDRFLSFWLVLIIGFFALQEAKKFGELPTFGNIKNKK